MRRLDKRYWRVRSNDDWHCHSDCHRGQGVEIEIREFHTPPQNVCYKCRGLMRLAEEEEIEYSDEDEQD